MGLVFYYTPMSSASRIHWALEELGVAYDKVKLDLQAGDQRKPEYLALNPNGKVPLLVVDGQPIFESLAILLYLGEAFGVEKGMFPAPESRKDRIEAFKWMSWVGVTVGETVTRVLRNTSDRFPKEHQNEHAGAAAKKEVGEQLAILDKALEGREYLVGSSFSLVDLAIAAYMPFLGRLGIDFGAHKNLQGWIGRCTARPALGRAMQG